MTRTSVWVKIPKLCHNTLLSIFSLGKGGNPYVSKPYIKTKYKCTLPCPQHEKDSDSDKTWTTHIKIAQNMDIFPMNFAPFQQQKGMKFSILFPVYNPGKKALPQDKIRAFLDAERHEFW